MSMVCPQCNNTYEQKLNCPTCGVRLMYSAPIRTTSDDSLPDAGQWQQTPWGRMFVGLALAQGLSYGIQQLVTAGLLATTGAETTVWTTLYGIVLLHVFQGFSLIIGGAVCGAGKQRGAVYGGLVGLVNGLIFLLVQNQSGETLTEMAMFGQPLMHMAFGALGGILGTIIWRPIPRLSFPELEKARKPMRIPDPMFRFLAGPIYLGRVLLGVFIVVVGVTWSTAILRMVLDAGQGVLEVRSHLQAQLVGWEICGLATLFGAGLAGSNTWNGLKQGLCVGVGAGFILAGIQMGSPKSTLETTIFMVAGILVLSVAGGWFGGQLFPPVYARKRRNRILMD
ncbi:MAG: YrzE family protein [Gemmataceae bacterium]|nr:YrzE family protein [Gemmataceae bacterium]